MLSRRTVLIAGSGLAAVGAAAATVGVGSSRRTLALELAALAPLVGSTFTADDGATRLTLSALTGPDGGAPRPDAFTLALTADAPVTLPGAVRTLHHPEGDLVLYVGPVGAIGDQLEAVVDRSV